MRSGFRLFILFTLLFILLLVRIHNTHAQGAYKTIAPVIDLLYLADASEGNHKYFKQLREGGHWINRGARKDDIIRLHDTVREIYTLRLDRETFEGYDGDIVQRMDGSEHGITNVAYHSFAPFNLTAHLNLLSGFFRIKNTKNGAEVVVNSGDRAKRHHDAGWGAVMERFERGILMKRALRNGAKVTSELAQIRWNEMKQKSPIFRLTEEEKSTTLAICVNGYDLAEVTRWKVYCSDLFNKYYGVRAVNVYGTKIDQPVAKIVHDIETWRQRNGENGFIFLGGMSLGGNAASAATIEIESRLNARGFATALDQ